MEHSFLETGGIESVSVPRFQIILIIAAPGTRMGQPSYNVVVITQVIGPMIRELQANFIGRTRSCPVTPVMRKFGPTKTDACSARHLRIRSTKCNPCASPSDSLQCARWPQNIRRCGFVERPNLARRPPGTWISASSALFPRERQAAHEVSRQ
jgi:hypothetical protein